MNMRSLLALCVLVFSVSAKAGMHVWTGAASDRFSDAGNWVGGSPAGDADAELVFPAGPERVVLTNDITGLTVRTISFSGVAYAIGGSPITMTGGAEVFDTTSGPNASRATCIWPAVRRFSPTTGLTIRSTLRRVWSFPGRSAGRGR